MQKNTSTPILTSDSCTAEVQMDRSCCDEESLRAAAMSLLYPTDDVDIDELDAQSGQIYQGMQALMSATGTTPNEEGELCLTLFLASEATMHHLSERDARTRLILKRIRRVLPHITDKTLKEKLRQIVIEN